MKKFLMLVLFDKQSRDKIGKVLLVIAAPFLLATTVAFSMAEGATQHNHAVICPQYVYIWSIKSQM